MKVALVIFLAGIAFTQAKLQFGLHSPHLDNSRIIQGKEAKVGQIPWQVAIKVKRFLGSDFCGGSLISDEWVLTSAHCIRNGDKYEMQFGGITTGLIEIGRVEITSKKAFVHPSYNEVTKNFDVALIQLPKKVKLNDRIQPIALPQKGETVAALRTVYVSGWGVTSDESRSGKKLHYVDLSSLSNSNCQNYYGKEEIIASTVCAEGFLEASPCDGDFGGPLYTTGKEGESTLVGIFSFYHPQGCIGFPSVYVRIEPLLAWINGYISI